MRIRAERASVSLAYSVHHSCMINNLSERSGQAIDPVSAYVEVGEIEMLVAISLRLREANAIDDRRVVELVRDDGVVSAAYGAINAPHASILEHHR